MSSVRLLTAIENGKLEVRTPSEEFVNQTRVLALQAGDTFCLSETDIQILALALELKMQGLSPLIITDDYSIQNVATQMNVQFVSLTTFGIKRQIQWTKYCPACHRKYPADDKQMTCKTCGTALKRKPMKKTILNIANEKKG